MAENEYDLPEWTTPDCYGGFDPVGDFVLYSRCRDSDLLSNSNYERMLEILQEEQEKYPEPPDDEDASYNHRSSWVYDFRAGHWAFGWMETILMRRDAPDCLQGFAKEILDALENYPVVDESYYCEKEWEAMCEYWENASMREKIRICVDAGQSMFAARRFPEDMAYETVNSYVNE